MQTSTRKRLHLVAASVVAALGVSGIAVAHSSHQDQLRATEAFVAAVSAQHQAEQVEREFWLAAEQQSSEARAAEHLRALTAERERVTSHIATHAELLSDTEGKVLDVEAHAALAEGIETLTEEASGAHMIRLREIPAEVDALAEAVADSHEEWQAEQERLRREREEAERRAREEAQRQAAAQQSRSTASAPAAPASGGASRGSSPASGSASSSSGATRASSGGSSNSSGGGMRAEAAAVLSRHGCGSAQVIWDDPRLGGYNGSALIGGAEVIMLNSGMPRDRLGYVAAHECAHLLQSRAYGHDLTALQEDMNRIYGGTGYAGLEQNADCITQRWGYSKWNYTTSCGGERGRAAQAIINGTRA